MLPGVLNLWANSLSIIKMNKEEKIYAKYGRDAGFKAPDGFLDKVYAEVEKNRGELPAYRHNVKATVWQKIRPYVALAAMFAGIWCMMKVFNVAQQTTISEPVAIDMSQPVSLDNPPQAIAQAVNTPEIQAEMQVTDAVVASAETDMELEQDIQQSYTDFSDFEEEFNYDFDEEYADMDIDALVADTKP